MSKPGARAARLFILCDQSAPLESSIATKRVRSATEARPSGWPASTFNTVIWKLTTPRPATATIPRRQDEAIGLPSHVQRPLWPAGRVFPIASFMTRKFAVPAAPSVNSVLERFRIRNADLPACPWELTDDRAAEHGSSTKLDQAIVQAVTETIKKTTRAFANAIEAARRPGRTHCSIAPFGGPVKRCCSQRLSRCCVYLSSV